MELLGLIDVPLWLLLIVMVASLLYVYGTWTHTVWSSQGVPGPKPTPLVGNLIEQMELTQFKVYSVWREKFGPITGIYLGVRPALVVSDLDMLREVLVKNFSNFADRNMLKGMRPPTIDKGLFFARGTAWKRIRNLMTPTFSTSKLKLMSRYVDRCGNLLQKGVDDKIRKGENIDVKDLFGSFTMDVIAGTAFGLETNSQTEEGEPFVQHCKKLFETFAAGGRLRRMIFFVNIFPFIGPWLGKLGVYFFNSEHSKFFVAAIDNMIDSRRAEPIHDKKSADMLQMLVESEADSDQITDRADHSDEARSHKRMTKEEIIGQGFITLIAGYETTATTLQYLSYNLALHPDVGEKIYQEIKDNIGDADPTYENITSLKYLDATIRESMRLFPPVAAVDRVAQQATTIRGIHIPEGAGVIIPIYSLMHDPAHFPDPDKFMPERFLDANRGQIDPLLVDLAFGSGPRQCIGMRLALLEIKFAAVRICRAFKILKCDETPEQITLGKSFGLATPDAPIMIRAELRTN